MTGRSPIDTGGPLPRLAVLGRDREEKERVLRDFGRHVRRLRTEAGLTHETLAAQCFVRHDHISDIERGLSGPSLLILLLLADAMEVSVSELIGELPAPTHEAGRAKILGVIARRPGVTRRALREAVGWPDSYVGLLVRYLVARGEIARQGGGWHVRKVEHHRPRPQMEAKPLKREAAARARKVRDQI
jgi:transcriptional regulator with XRE-family HTH domain